MARDRKLTPEEQLRRRQFDELFLRTCIKPDDDIQERANDATMANALGSAGYKSEGNPDEQEEAE